MDIEDWRKAIDDIDEQLVVLLNKRANCAIEVGRVKRARGIEIYQPDREQQVIRHANSVNQGPLDEAAIRRLFERIIDESRRVERVIVAQEEERQLQIEIEHT
ncbi:MAG TPA: chorismate mutase [Blastocatellia bacterium]|nr:chorismate mutase [Blastocatellia bacterium]